MTFLDDFNNGQDAQFQAKVSAALLEFVEIEVATFDSDTTDREKRFVRAIILAPRAIAAIVAPYIAAADQISDASSDTDIRNSISGNKDVLALETFDEADV